MFPGLQTIAGGGLGGFSTTGGTAGPATNNAVNVTGSVGSLTDLQRLIGLTQGPPSNGGIPWNWQGYETPVVANRNQSGFSVPPLLILGAVGIVALLLIVK